MPKSRISLHATQNRQGGLTYSGLSCRAGVLLWLSMRELRRLRARLFRSSIDESVSSSLSYARHMLRVKAIYVYVCISVCM
jgi:hypothetical protein